jgi:predicted DNA-binding transcriptional regulator AlpA
MPVILHKPKPVGLVSSAAPSFEALINMNELEFLAKPKLNRGRPNSVLRASRESQGDFDAIDQDEAAAIIGKSTKTLQRWRDREYGPPFELDGRYVSYSRASIQAWKAEHNFRRTPTKVLRQGG